MEGSAIATLIAMVMETGRGVHVAHLSSEIGLAFIRDAQRRGLPVTVETCPHYLLFTSDSLREVRAYGKVNPPIRGERDRKGIMVGP